MSDGKPTRTAAKLRDDIDRGRAGDKVGFPDPAAAPLGTDAEAGSAGPTREQVRTARRYEVEKRPDGPTVASGPRPVSLSEPSTGRPVGMMALMVVLALVVLAGLGVLYVALG